jgi:phage FluMu protein Com
LTMKLELALQKSKIFPQIDDPLKYVEARIWNCKFSTLVPLKQLQNLKRLEIFVFPDETLEIIGSLVHLQSLEIMHFQKVTELTPLSNLSALEELELSTSPGSYKAQHIKSLAPLKNLAHLKRFALRGIIVDDGSLEPLHSCHSLTEFVSGNFFSIEQLVKLAINKPALQGSLLKPLCELPHIHCQKCGSQKVLLEGKIKSSIKCPKCNQSQVSRHIQEWKSCRQETIV